MAAKAAFMKIPHAILACALAVRGVAAPEGATDGGAETIADASARADPVSAMSARVSVSAPPADAASSFPSISRRARRAADTLEEAVTGPAGAAAAAEMEDEEEERAPRAEGPGAEARALPGCDFGEPTAAT